MPEMSSADQSLILKCPFRVTSADTDMEARLRPGALLNMLIQSAIQSADYLHLGFGDLSKEKLFWVLSRMTIKIERPVKWYEDLIVETWPRDVDGLLYFRDFIVRDAAGEITARAVSAWLAVDLISKRPKVISSVNAPELTRLKDRRALQETPLKIGPVETESSVEVLTTYFDIDLNRHVTSTRYLDWMFDALPADYLMTHYPSKVSINYLKETKPGETMLLGWQRNGNSIRFEGRHKSTGQASVRGVLELGE